MKKYLFLLVTFFLPALLLAQMSENSLGYFNLEENNCITTLGNQGDQGDILGCGSVKQVIKVSATSLIFKAVYPSYEYVLSDNKSVQLGFYFVPKGPLPLLATLYDLIDRRDVDSLMGLDGFFINGYSVTPEFRFYLSKKKKAPCGFYVAPYLRYTNLQLSGDFKYYNTDRDRAEVAFVDDDSKATFVTGGAMIGMQWIIGRISIDWWMFGLAYGYNNIYFELFGEPGTINPADFEDIRDEVNETLGGYGDLEVPILTDSRGAFDLTFNLPSVRSGVTIGIGL